MAAIARQCAITLLPNNVEMHIGFKHPGNQFRAVDYKYFTKLWGGGQMLRQENDTS